VELAANQDMFFPFLCMRGRHVTWENTFSTPNSGEHSTHHLAAPYSSCSSCKRQQPPSSLHHTASSPLTEKQHGLHHSAPDSSRQTCWTAAAWSAQFPKAGQHLQHSTLPAAHFRTAAPAPFPLNWTAASPHHHASYSNLQLLDSCWTTHSAPAASGSTCKGQNLCWTIAWAAPVHLTSSISKAAEWADTPL
jgi:hypothetical protein